MINEQRWKTNYVGRSEAGNCFYENVNCVCQADTKERVGGGGVQGAEPVTGQKEKRKLKAEDVDWMSTAPLVAVIGAFSC